MSYGTKCWWEGPFTAAGGEGAIPTRKETQLPPRPVWQAVRVRVEALMAESVQWTGGKQRLTATRLHQVTASG